MPVSPGLLRHLHRLVARAAAPSCGDTDGDLLARWVRRRDEDAFAAIVHRHGSMVLQVCRRALGDAHAAEDAAQATFLVLARRAAAVRPGHAVAAWLHGIARRVAAKARAAEARRRRREVASVARPRQGADPLDNLTARELLAVLDEEIVRLPPRYRLPVVLCCLQDRSVAEAARVLGWTVGSVKGRLERGRARLRARLARRGLDLAALLLAAGVSQGDAAAAVASCRAAPRPAVAALAAAVLRDMAGVRVLLAALVVGALVGGLGFGLRGRSDETADPPPAAAAHDPPDKPHARVDADGEPLPAGALARLGTLRYRVAGNVRALFLPDNRSLVAVVRDGGSTDVSLWDATTGTRVRQLARLEGKDSDPERRLRQLARLDGSYPDSEPVAVSGDGKAVAVAAFDEQAFISRVRVLDAASGKEIRSFDIPGWVSQIFLPGDHTLVSAERTGLVVRNLATGAERVRWKRGSGARTDFECALAPDGKTLAATGTDGPLGFWDVGTGKKRRAVARDGHADIAYLAFTPDGSALAEASEGSAGVRLWDVATGKLLRSFAAPEHVSRIAFSRDGGTMATAGNSDGKDSFVGRRGVVRLWDTATGNERRRLEGKPPYALALAFSADGQTLALGGPGTLGFWDARTGKSRTPAGVHDAPVFGVAFAPDGGALATAGLDGLVCVWDVAAGKLRRQFTGADGQRLWDVAWAPDGRTLAVAGHNWCVRLWDSVTGREGRDFSGIQGLVRHVAFPGDSRTLAAAGRDGAVLVWDVDTGRERRRIPGADGAVGTVAFATNRPRCAVSQEWHPDDTRAYDLASGAVIRTWSGKGDYVFALSADGQLTAEGRDFPADGRDFPKATSDRTLRVRNIASGSVSRCQLPPSRATAAAFAPDGKMLAVGCADGSLNLMDVATGQCRRHLAGHQTLVPAVQFSPDGRLLASASFDTTVLVWDVLATGDGAKRPSPERLRALWKDLAGSAGAAFDAIALLAAFPDDAVVFLRDTLRPVAGPDAAGLARLIAGLDAKTAAEREAAVTELGKLGVRARSAMEEALENKPSPKARYRMEGLLERLPPEESSPEQLREMRAVETLEYIATPAARRLLEALAGGTPGARLTREAKATLERLDARKSSTRPNK